MKGLWIEDICKIHGAQRHKPKGGTGLRCRVCRIEAVSRRRKKIKALLVEELGGKCRVCGYDRCIRALEFHHIDPLKKSFALSVNNARTSLQRLREEAQKCVLVCSNCHRELEDRFITLADVV